MSFKVTDIHLRKQNKKPFIVVDTLYKSPDLEYELEWSFTFGEEAMNMTLKEIAEECERRSEDEEEEDEII